MRSMACSFARSPRWPVTSKAQTSPLTGDAALPRTLPRTLPRMMKDARARGGEAMPPDESLEESLDALLSQRQRDDGSNGLSAPGPATSATADQRADAQPPEIDDLLGAANRFAVWGDAEPTPV